MENILLETVDAVINGATFKVDLKGRNLLVGKKKIIDNGEYDGELGIEDVSTDDFVDTVAELYRQYHHSIPTEMSSHKRKTYFKALPERELSDDDMVTGERRDIAQCMLETFILCCAIKGIEWNELDKRGGFFWQHPSEKGLVIFKDWVA